MAVTRSCPLSSTAVSCAPIAAKALGAERKARPVRSVIAAAKRPAKSGYELAKALKSNGTGLANIFEKADFSDLGPVTK
jgi:hypothetical protein